MKIALISDLHLTEKNFVCRLDNVRETQLKKIRFVFDWVVKNDSVLLCAADVFDKPRGYNILTDCLKEFEPMKKRFLTVFGQHDMFYRRQIPETNLGLLEMEKYVRILIKSGYRLNNNISLYGCSYGEEVPEIESRDKDVQTRILVIHAPIYDKQIPNVSGSPARSFLRNHPEYKLIVSGDIHQKFVIEDNGRYIVNTGCMLRKSVDIANHKPCFFVYDTDTNSIEEIEIPHEPMETVISEKHLTEKTYLTESLNEFIETIGETNTDKSKVSFRENLDLLITENNIDQDVIDILENVMSGGKL